MRRRLSALISAFGCALLLAPSPSFAQQSLNIYVGGFFPLGLNARDFDDVLFQNQDYLAFWFPDFNGPTIGAEYLVGIGDFVEAGAGIGYYKQTVPSVYADLINDNGSEIYQDLRLRITPMTATFRFLPLGRNAGVVPYVGAGVGIFSWRYSETGDWVDPIDGTIYFDNFVGSGTSVGPVFLGGLRVPLGMMDVGGEVRYQRATGDLPADQFYSSKIDLGGWTYSATFNIRF